MIGASGEPRPMAQGFAHGGKVERAEGEIALDGERQAAVGQKVVFDLIAVWA